MFTRTSHQGVTSMTILPVTIQYGAHAVQAPVVVQPVVHAMAEPGKTLCGKRPLAYTAVSNEFVTCEKCRAEMDAQHITQRPPSTPKKATKPRQPRKERHVLTAEERRQRNREYQHNWYVKHRATMTPRPRRKPVPITPEVEQALHAADGKARSIWLTEKGLAAVRKWEAEEKQIARGDTRA